jgi:ankyrin repeat protein
MCACACKRIDDERLVNTVKLLVDNGANYKSSDKYVSFFKTWLHFIVTSFYRYCMTPLMFASREGNLSVLKYLITLGVDINQQDENGWTVYLVNLVFSFFKVVLL